MAGNTRRAKDGVIVVFVTSTRVATDSVGTDAVSKARLGLHAAFVHIRGTVLSCKSVWTAYIGSWVVNAKEIASHSGHTFVEVSITPFTSVAISTCAGKTRSIRPYTACSSVLTYIARACIQLSLTAKASVSDAAVARASSDIILTVDAVFAQVFVCASNNAGSRAVTASEPQWTRAVVRAVGVRAIATVLADFWLVLR